MGKTDQNPTSAHIVKLGRNFVIIQLGNGTQHRYERVMPTLRKTSPQKPSVRKPKLAKPMISKAEQAAKKMVPCVVRIENLTPVRITSIQRMFKRRGKLQANKEKPSSQSYKNVNVNDDLFGDFGGFEIETDPFDETTIIQPLPIATIDPPLTVQIPSVFDAAMARAICEPYYVPIAQNINPIVTVRADGNFAIEMPFVEGEPKTTFFISKELLSTVQVASPNESPSIMNSSFNRIGDISSVSLTDSSEFCSPLTVQIPSVFDTAMARAICEPNDVPIAQTIKPVAKMFDWKWTVGSKIKNPILTVQADGNFAIEMPFVEGKPKTTFFISKELLSTVQVASPNEPPSIMNILFNRIGDIGSVSLGDSSEFGSPLTVQIPSVFDAEMARAICEPYDVPIAQTIQPVARMFDWKWTVGYKIENPFLTDGNFAIEMPFVEGKPKTTFYISKELLSTVQVASSNESASIMNVSFNQNGIDSDDYTDNEDDNDGGSEFDSTDSSEWGSPLSPDTFHAKMDVLLNGVQKKLFK